MVEQNAVGRVHPVRLAVIDCNPVRIQLGYAIWAARVKRCRFVLRRDVCFAKQFRGRSLVIASLLFQTENAYRFKYAQCSKSVGIGRVFRRFEAHLHVALRRKSIDLVRLCLLNQANEVGGVGQITVVQKEARPVIVWIDVKVVDALRNEGRRAPLDARCDVPFFKQ